MAGIKISALPPIVAPALTDEFPVVQSGVTYKETGTQFASLLGFTTGILDLAHGGTNANLTAVNGGIVYSTATELAISAAGSAGQIIRSAGTATPTWSTATFASTYAINTILYNATANTVTGLATANSATLITSAGGVPSLSQTLPSAVQTNITALGAQAQALNMNTHLINGVVDPVSAQDAATKNYVDQTAQGRVYKDPCVAATTGAFSATYSNGASGVGATLTGTVMAAFAPDGVTLAVGDRVLFKNQVSSFQNGIYTTTTLGTGAVLPVFTRSLDMDKASEFAGATTFLTGGSTQGGQTYTETAVVVTVGTDPVTFSLTGDGSGVTSVGSGTGLTGGPITSTGTLALTYPVSAGGNIMQSLVVATANTHNGVTGDGTSYDIVFDTVNTDRNGDFSANTTFTAPVTANYLFVLSLILTGVAANTTFEVFVNTAGAGPDLLSLGVFSVTTYGATPTLSASGVIPLSATNARTIRLIVSGSGTPNINVFSGTRISIYQLG